MSVKNVNQDMELLMDNAQAVIRILIVLIAMEMLMYVRNVNLDIDYLMEAATKTERK